MKLAQKVTSLTEQLKQNATAVASAKEDVAAISDRISTERAALDQTTRRAYSSLSGRKVGFEKAKQLHPEIRRSAQLWWWAFFAAEILPVLLKTLLFQNNPTAAEAQADLSEDASRHRIRSWRASIVENNYKAVLTRDEVHAAIEDTLVPYAAASEHLISLGHFLDRLVAEHQREQNIARAHPDLAAQVHRAYANAVANALDTLRRHQAPLAPAE